MRKGQFGNWLVDVVVWLIILGIVAYLVIHYIVGTGGILPKPGGI
jgi:hypothetical protein